VGVLSPAFERQFCPVHSVMLPSVFSVTDFGEKKVRHNAAVDELGPKL
jgi:hypothetical protein